MKDHHVVYRVKGKAGTRYYHTWCGIIMYDTIFAPLGEETIITVSSEEFDRMINNGKLSFQH